MVAFHDVLEFMCSLFFKAAYTYDNSHARSANIKVRLDQVVANNQRRGFFVEASVKHLVAPSLDDALILLKSLT